MKPVHVIADMVKRVLRTEKYYIPKFVELFEQLPEVLQVAMLKYIVDEVGSNKRSTNSWGLCRVGWCELGSGGWWAIVNIIRLTA